MINAEHLRHVFLSFAIVAATSAEAQFPPARFSPEAGLKSLQDSLQDAVRSASESENRPSMAMIDRERARSMSYDNQIKELQTIFEKRRMRQRFKDEQSRAVEERRRVRAARGGQQGPDRLTTAQYDRYSGVIHWPAAIRTGAYAAERDRLDSLFSAHCEAGGGVDTFQYAEIQEAIGQLNSRVKKQVKVMNSEQYMYTRRFLDGLRYEARVPVGG